ncbi:hypothetical protein M1615_01350 [Patescibacteria group bacterium]|nr:hypothetical protein [Patescibacteria group bacterium]MCL5010097.1 hypothetical protein [Patescibacteria group bacterium]
MNHFAKISIHAAVIFAFVISMAFMYGAKALIATFWMIPLVAWARIESKKHTVGEVVLGGLSGSLITVITFILGKIML